MTAVTLVHAARKELLEAIFSVLSALRARGSNLAAVKLTTVQVTKLPL
jgi:hypothetical protein